MIRFFNQISNWISTEILQDHPTAEDRAQAINKLLQIASKLMELHNYNGAFEIMAGLNNTAIHRLKQTFPKISTVSKQIMQQLNNLSNTDLNYKSLRDSIKLASLPAIPYLGLYLTDLTMIDTGNTDRIAQSLPDGTTIELINFLKLRTSAQVITQIQNYQTIPFSYHPVKRIQDFIRECSSKALSDDDQLYELSLKMEPKVNKDK